MYRRPGPGHRHGAGGGDVWPWVATDEDGLDQDGAGEDSVRAQREASQHAWPGARPARHIAPAVSEREQLQYARRHLFHAVSQHGGGVRRLQSEHHQERQPGDDASQQHGIVVIHDPTGVLYWDV